MGSHLQKLNKLLLCSFILSLFVIFESCTQVTPELRNSNYSVVFEYDAAQEFPDARLSIFVESDSDVRRFERIIVKSLETGYVWDFDDIKKIEIDGIKYAGATNLIAPENEVIPTGAYIITCVNADEKQAELKITVSYDEALYELKENEIEDFIAKKNGNKKVAIYDKDNSIIYYGPRTENLQTTRDIWNYYRNAEYYQDILSTSSNTVICISSAHKVAPEK